MEGKSRQELKKQGQEIFGINSRFCDDAILKAREIIGSRSRPPRDAQEARRMAALGLFYFCKK